MNYELFPFFNGPIEPLVIKDDLNKGNFACYTNLLILLIVAISNKIKTVRPELHVLKFHAK